MKRKVVVIDDFTGFITTEYSDYRYYIEKKQYYIEKGYYVKIGDKNFIWETNGQIVLTKKYNKDLTHREILHDIIENLTELLKEQK